MSELSDYRRMVEAPMIKRYEERLRAAHSEIDRLRSSLPEREEIVRELQALYNKTGWQSTADLLDRLRAHEQGGKP